MKKKVTWLSVAAVATMFAACSNDAVKTDIVNNSQTEATKAIGFSSFSEKTTRGNATVNTNLEYYHNTFAVYGTKQSVNDATDIQYVFGGKATAAGTQDGVTCTYQTTADAVLGDWKYTDPRYWDKQATYDFIAYAPVSANNPIRYNYSATTAQVADAGNEFKTTSTYTLAGTNLQATATEAEKVKGFTVEAAGDLDLMISASNAQNGDGHTEYVNLVFRHILSKLNVTFAKSSTLDNANVTINSVKISGLDDSGDYVESDYDDNANPKKSGWASSQVATTYALEYNAAGGQALNASTANKPYFFIESLVMPQEITDGQVTLVANYTITSGTYSENYNYNLDLYDIAALHKFYDGYNYTLNFTIDPDVIKFDATVTTWDDQAAIGKTID
ncbi:MAG: fimbrillin family protein [Bacteroidaceae bacterium]|nr:fimbrillin family protein [Bacteroidaceae bacterium]